MDASIDWVAVVGPQEYLDKILVECDRKIARSMKVPFCLLSADSF
jgi:hypothetical protein